LLLQQGHLRIVVAGQVAGHRGPDDAAPDDGRAQGHGSSGGTKGGGGVRWAAGVRGRVIGWATRSALLAKRGSAASSGRPSASASRPKSLSLAAATASGRSAVASTSYGAMLGWVLPIACGTAPVTTWVEAWLVRAERIEDRRLTSTRCPSPVWSRWRSAARTSIVA